MKRVLIIGSNGAGKSTFSYALADKTNLPLIHIDQLYWRNNWEVTPREEFLSLAFAEAQKPCWIIEGNNIRSLEDRLQFADTVSWFEFPPALCVWNVLKRTCKYHGRVRADMPDEFVCRLNVGFLKDVWRFNKKITTESERSLLPRKTYRLFDLRTINRLGHILNHCEGG